MQPPKKKSVSGYSRPPDTHPVFPKQNNHLYQLLLTLGSLPGPHTGGHQEHRPQGSCVVYYHCGTFTQSTASHDSLELSSSACLPSEEYSSSSQLGQTFFFKILFTYLFSAYTHADFTCTGQRTTFRTMVSFFSVSVYFVPAAPWASGQFLRVCFSSCHRSAGIHRWCATALDFYMGIELGSS